MSVNMLVTEKVSPDLEGEPASDAVARPDFVGNSNLHAKIDEEKEERNLDAPSAEIIAVYSDAPISGPDWFVAKVAAAAAFANRLAGTSNWTIGNGPGSLANQTREEAAKEEAEKAWESFEELIDLVEDQQKQEREAWERTTHSFAGLNLTGAEYGELGDALAEGGALHDWLIERMKRDGKSEAQAKHDTDLIALAMHGMKLPENQRTPEMLAAIQQVNNSPALSQYAQDAEAHNGQSSYGVGNTSGHDTTHLTNTDRETSVVSGADAMYGDVKERPLPQPICAQSVSETSSTARNEGYRIFPTAPPVGEDYRAALAATKPLDAAPVRIAAAPPPPGFAGLDQ